jgi:nicotinamide phosphoribosyltransferase
MILEKKESILYKTDSYKASHFLQFPVGTTETFYYVEPRIKDTTIKVFGTQMLLEKHLTDVPTLFEIDEAEDFWKSHGLPFNKKGWYHINMLGYLPLEINAVPEGTLMPSGTMMLSVRNTDNESFWLPGWVETMLMQIWYPTTVCTNSYDCKSVILKYLERTGTPSLIDFKLHDFGYRGCTSQEAAEIGGAAHLVNFKGTDTVAGIRSAMKYYGSDMPGFSIPAAEHSTITSWGRENEESAYKNMLDKFARPGSIVAVVSDSYDLDNAVLNMWGGSLRDQIIQSGATVVIRPDSGEPAEVVLRVLDMLAEKFGVTFNGKGYKVLPDYIRVIQGDGLDGFKEIDDVLCNITYEGYSADNVAFGMGGGLLQKCNRDTLKFAMKCSAVKVNGVWRDVNKSPKDAPWKASKGGILELTDNFITVRKDNYNGPSGMKKVFMNGKINKTTFDEIRNM